MKYKTAIEIMFFELFLALVFPTIKLITNNDIFIFIGAIFFFIFLITGVLTMVGVMNRKFLD